jgi:hypothetical protein
MSAQESHQRAERCLQLAKEAPSAKLKDVLLAEAQAWKCLAEEQEWLRQRAAKRWARQVVKRWVGESPD